jgi:hypothetical protein
MRRGWARLVAWITGVFSGKDDSNGSIDLYRVFLILAIVLIIVVLWLLVDVNVSSKQ